MRPTTPESLFARALRVGGCLIWQGCVSTGYGNVKYEGRQWGAHRLAYHLAVGPIPEGAVIRHTCDNPRCIEPTHLLPGTHADNKNDAVTRRRHAFHEGHGMHRLTEELVAEIREAAARGVMHKTLAAQYGVGVSQIWNIVHFRQWVTTDPELKS